jgi:hypothetical protein
MGLLDDAIREHLDLKRRRGADPTEVEREEREVLGPVRRRGEEAGADELDHAQMDELDHEPLAHDDDVRWANGGSDYGQGEPGQARAAADYDPDPDEETYRAPEPYPSVPREPEPPPARYEPEPYPASRYEPEPPPARYEPEAHPAAAYEPDPEPYRGEAHDRDDAGPSTVEYSIEDEDADHEEGESEDVLEETPEFLQDTPDHDRLWFEQRPPRDFDFDG